MSIATSARLYPSLCDLVDQCAELLSLLDQGTAVKMTAGCPTTIVSRSNEERTRIIKLQVPLRSFADFHRQMITTELRNIPANVKKPFTVHSNIKLTNLYNSMSYFDSFTHSLQLRMVARSVPGKAVYQSETMASPLSIYPLV
ncbi:Hypothetical predicted protein [Paramuricea clavata]|uniref:Uncharacterized protein n=1 Tax=Paramuricea clavata TaxID=317549 RepID=A0A7D9LHH6_PARCT|nr:Hypothetical predicted protein [Paramuricea clavata]